MLRRPHNRAVHSADVTTRQPDAATKRQAHRAMATVADVLGRDPNDDDVFVGGTGLISRKSKIATRKSKLA